MDNASSFLQRFRHFRAAINELGVGVYCVGDRRRKKTSIMMKCYVNLNAYVRPSVQLKGEESSRQSVGWSVGG